MQTKSKEYPLDIYGNKVSVGDEILLALSFGRGAQMKRYKILSIEVGASYYGSPEFKVRAELIHSPTYGEVGKVSHLHGELFHQRAFVIMKNED